MKHCCICGQLFEGYGNNPAPVETRGECCDDCHINVVIPRRERDAKKAQIIEAADALTSTPLQPAESAKLNALVGKVVEIEYTDGDIEIGILHKDTPAIRYQYLDSDNTKICGYWLDRINGELHFKKSHVKKIRPTEAAQTSQESKQLNELCGKSVLIKFNDGSVAAGFLHKQTIITDNNAPIIHYCLVTPIRNIVFFNSDIKSIREERYGN